VSIDAGDPALSSSTRRLGGHEFAFVQSLIPKRDASDAIMEFSPHGDYAKADVSRLHKHGHGTFCKFRIVVQQGLERQGGVYALIVDESVCYIGECEDLVRRFNAGFGNIYPRNCYVNGRSTDCKVNRRVLEASKAGGRVDLYFLPTPERKAVEQRLIACYAPPWNQRLR
jgi:hypothetical protein